jgi:hypothetical protein
MKVLSYKYLLPNTEGIIEELDRDGYMTTQYIRLVEDYINTIELKGKVAFLYAGGVTATVSECRNAVNTDKYREKLKPSGMGIRDLAAYSMHKWVGMMNGKENICYANINGNTCASSMYCIYEAQELLKNGYDEVIIVAEEKTSHSTLRVFDELRIDIKIGEALAIIHLGKGTGISNCKVWYEYNSNPFGVTPTGYCKVVSDSDYINPHGTGTAINECAESEVYGDTPQLRYKETIGHTQGVSGLVEVCMVLDEDVSGKVLCVSSGLGGFYASCIVHK